ncbi:Alpha/Beta hydrolase protein [Pyronema omphalodes]|nr:Alpha/Beta hydrolase protein [Pyronema omphalodes]
MLSSPLGLVIGLLIFTGLSFAEHGYPPPVSGLKVIKTPGNDKVYVTYKQPSNDICVTTNPAQKQFTGHVHLPPYIFGQEYPISTFFWFVEARENPENAPLTIWMNGGPGTSSLLGFMQEVGPCMAVPFSKETIATEPREWSWDAASNMLFIDQPNHVGFSYDIPVNGTLPLLDPNAQFQAYYEAITNLLMFNGTFPSGNSKLTANTTEVSAIAVWHFLQGWLKSFPQYDPKDAGVNLFAESYGGKYGPAFFNYFDKQNKRREAGELSANDTIPLHLGALGIVNGCIDAAIQTPEYMNYAYDNPYRIEGLNVSVRNFGLNQFYMPSGCKDWIQSCRQLSKDFDNENLGNSESVNSVCGTATTICDTITTLWDVSERGYYDISHSRRDPFPGEFHTEWLNNATVQEAIGARTNWTQSSTTVYTNFKHSGDFVRDGQMQAISNLLQNGVRVALIYGKDYICNWLGGEAVSLAIDYPDADGFRSAGYQNIDVNGTYIGGQVRQHGNFSFSRVYQAGHLVPAYQPETAFRIFERAIKGLSIATGEAIQHSGNETYTTTGRRKSSKVLVPPHPPEPTCFIRNVATCDESHWNAFAMKNVVIYNGVAYLSEDEYASTHPATGFFSLAPKPEEKNNGSPLVENKTDEEGTHVKRSGSSTMVPSLCALVIAIIVCIALD